MKHFFLLCVGASLLVSLGCVGKKKPDGLPELYPTIITITTEGNPLEGASVVLMPSDPDNRWAAAGITDSSGKAVIRTYAQFLGAPEGKFKVCVTKTYTDPSIPLPRPGEPGPLPPSYELVNPKFGRPDKTDFEMEVVAGKKNTETFDVGKEVKIRSDGNF